MQRLVTMSAIAAVVTAAFLTGSGFGSSAVRVRSTHALPAGLSAAIHARLGAGAVKSGSARNSFIDPAFGFSVALSADGTTALVGAYGAASGKGAAYIFHSSAGTWTSRSAPAATLTSKHGTTIGLFGYAVALSADGTTAVVGAPLDQISKFTEGAIYVFHASAEDAWSSSSTPKATLAVANSGLLGIGLALSPDGTTLVAGAPLYNNMAGGAYVFQASNEGAWTSSMSPVATLRNASESAGDGDVGAQVAISADGTTALLSNDGSPSGGGAYLYHVSAENAWASSSTPTAILSDSNSLANDRLGAVLALSSDGTLALLATENGEATSGYAAVFHSSGEAAWASTSTPDATLSPPAGTSGAAFGARVALSSDGMTALVTDPSVHSGRGAAYVFRASGEAAWASSSAPTATLTNSGGHANDALFVGALTGDGATALVGAPGVDKQTGAVDVFHAADASSWASSSSPNAILTDKKLAACVVPRLKGLKLAPARLALALARCNLGKVTKVHTKTKKSRGRVLSQSKKPGKRLAIDAKVSIKVGK